MEIDIYIHIFISIYSYIFVSIKILVEKNTEKSYEIVVLIFIREISICWRNHHDADKRSISRPISISLDKREE